MPAQRSEPTWGLVATIKAPMAEVLGFAAHHLDLGAHRLHIHLDEPAPETHARLKAHPRIRVHTCDERWWRRVGRERPAKHQSRQTHNATRTYRRDPQVDWLIHIDVDEFLWPRTSVAGTLAGLPAAVSAARVRPIEALAGTANLFKAFIPPGPDRAPTVERLYPTYGRFVKGGFLSHVAGKTFVRTGLPDLSVRIHMVFQDGNRRLNEVELSDLSLCHCHARDWTDWLANYRYRLHHGSYRAELSPARAHDKGGLTLHELFTTIEDHDGEAGLKAFHDEVCADTPRLRAALEAEGLLRRCELGLDAKIRKHFPD